MSLRVFDRDSNPNIDRPAFRVSNALGNKYIAQGIAKLVDSGKHKALQLLQKRSQTETLSSQQGWIYEALAIEKYPQIFQGGMTRTETQPNPKPGILSWGHIGETK